MLTIVSTSKDQLVVQARTLYVQGSSIPDIAIALDKSESTIYRYRDEDAKRGIRWDDRRTLRRQNDPQALLVLCEKRRQQIMEADAPSLADQCARADAFQKITKAISMIREEYGDYTVLLDALQDFAKWGCDNLSKEDRAVLYRAVEAYTEDVKRRAK